MSYLEAIILGVIQGLTEFLPVSSSGHLELAKAFFGDNSLPQESLTFTVILHFATALSTIVIFRKELIQIFRGLFQFICTGRCRADDDCADQHSDTARDSWHCRVGTGGCAIDAGGSGRFVVDYCDCVTERCAAGRHPVSRCVAG